ncbi:DUF2917 domain-containing protein [Polaromonas sp. C04]|uniref:DUF2917 domain-containing protein n=1 Tax=Polaromonas sp. C04 TaxID=1945857 RepID=UPI00143B085E|nr:DUF2917 domain-containing protein [Polaromonas sp. C04]
MTSQNVLQLQQPTPGAALPGCWKLDAGRAVTLRPREAGVFRVAQGQVWATLQGPHRGPANDLGDRFLSPGESLALWAGQRLVLEPWDAASSAPAWFSWDPQPAAAPNPRRAARGWGVAVGQPLADLRLALCSVARALGGAAGAVVRLGAGLAGFAIDLLADRVRPAWAERAFSADSRASRAHGAMNCADSIASTGAL